MSPSKKQINPNIKRSLFSLASEATVNISLWKLISQPIKLIFTNWQSFFLLGIPVVLVLTINSMLSGHAITCGTPALIGTTTFACDGTVPAYYVDLSLRFLIISLFAIKWYQFSLLKTKITAKNLFLLKKFEFKAFGLLCILDLINIAPIIAIVLLFFRDPNPNWQIELAYFTSVAWLFLLPFITLRFYPYFALAVENKKLPNPLFLWNKTKGNMIKFLLGISILVFLALFLFMQYYAFIQSVDSLTNFEIASVEFEYNILMVLFIIGYTNFCYVQKNLLFKGDTNE